MPMKFLFRQNFRRTMRAPAGWAERGPDARRPIRENGEGRIKGEGRCSVSLFLLPLGAVTLVCEEFYFARCPWRTKTDNFSTFLFVCQLLIILFFLFFYLDLLFLRFITLTSWGKEGVDRIMNRFIYSKISCFLLILSLFISLIHCHSIIHPSVCLSVRFNPYNLFHPSNVFYCFYCFKFKNS